MKPVMKICATATIAMALMCGCDKPHSQTPEGITGYLDALEIDSNQRKGIDAYLVIPADICPSCINNYRNFISATDLQNILFIVSGYHAKKIRLTFGDDVVSKSNVIVDDKGLLYKTGLSRDMAEIFLINNGRPDQQKRIDALHVKEELSKLQGYLLEQEEAKQDILPIDAKIERMLTPGDLSPFKVLIGKEVPLLRTHTLNGRLFDLDSYQGRAVVLNFWRLNCGECFKEIDQLNRVGEDAEREDFVFVSVCADAAGKILERMEKTPEGGLRRISEDRDRYTMRYEVIPGGKELAGALGVTAYPVTLVMEVMDGKAIVRYAVGYTKLMLYPEEPATYMLIKKAIRNVQDGKK